jgi:hypothetical protein
MSGEVDRPSSVRQLVRPALVLLPVLLVLVGLFALKHGARRPRGEHARPPQVETRAEIPGWSASVPHPLGGRRELQLSPVHVDGARQRFEAVTRERRFGLEAGEAWRLNLRWVIDPQDPGAGTATGQESGAGPATAQESGAGPATAQESGAGPATAQESGAGPAPGPGLPLQRLQIADGGGVRLRPLDLESAAPGLDRPADPVAVLFTPPREALAAGEGVSLILWGCAPSGEAFVQDLLEEAIVLHPAGLAMEEVTRALVQVARSPAPALPGAELSDGEPVGEEP